MCQNYDLLCLPNKVPTINFAGRNLPLHNRKHKRRRPSKNPVASIAKQRNLAWTSYYLHPFLGDNVYGGVHPGPRRPTPLQHNVAALIGSDSAYRLRRLLGSGPEERQVSWKSAFQTHQDADQGSRGLRNRGQL